MNDPAAIAQNMNLGITDEASYSEAVGAISASEFVLYDYRRNPRPRVAGVVASLMEFATRNPLASEPQLSLYAQALALGWQAAAPGDPELRRSANFLPALRFTRITGLEDLRGFDTAVGDGAALLLDLTVPGPVDYASLKSRMVRYESTRGRAFANSSEFSHLLVLGLLGRDTTGTENPALAIVMRDYLESEGYEPVPDGVDDERFAAVYDGLATLPSNYDDFVAAITVPMGEEAPPIWAQIGAQFDAISAATAAQFLELQDANTNGPDLLEGVAIGLDPVVLDKFQADFQARLQQIATPNTVLSANALLLFQSEDPTIRGYAHHAEITGELLGDGYDGHAIAIAGAKILGGAAMVGVGIATGWTGVGILTAVAGAFVAVEGGIQLADELQNGAAPPFIEQQIFDQIINVRQDIENMRVEMHLRFDRIESQLNFMFFGMSTGFNAIGMAVGELQDTVENLTRDVLLNRALIERLEDALYGLAEDLLDADLASRCNNYLDYRGANGVDLPYAGAESFLDGANEFFTVAVDIAQNTTFAGPLTSTLSVASADETLNGASIGRNVNDLRNFPFNALGLPRLLGIRLVAPAPWAQGAAAYAQFVRENPWYFAYQYEQQSVDRGTLPDVDLILQHGENLATAMLNGRSQTLFDALFEGYDDAVADLHSAIGAHLVSVGVLPAYWSNGPSTVDPLGGIEQDVSALAPVPVVSPDTLPLAEPVEMWEVCRTPLARLWAVINPDNGLVGDEPTPSLSWFTTNSSTDWNPASSSNPQILGFNTGSESPQQLGCLSWVFIDRDISYHLVGAASSASQISSAWSAGPLRDALLSGENLVGHVIPVPAPGFTPFRRSVQGWLKAIDGTPDLVCMDQIFPGDAGDTGCLSGTAPVVLALSGGQVTIRVLSNNNTPLCVVSDGSTPTAVSDIGSINASRRAVFEFDPPISAFYTYYGSFEAASSATLTAYDSMGAVIGSSVRTREGQQAGALSHGFISGALVSRVEITTNDAGLVIGAFTGLAPFDPSLGTVNIPGYAGPAGATVQIDFGCFFGPLPPATMTIAADELEYNDACGDDLPGDLADYLESYIAPALAETISELESPGTNLIKSGAGFLSDWETLIEAYSTFSLPEAMDSSTALRAALGGHPQTSELRMSGAAILPVCQQLLLGEIPIRPIPDIMLERSAIAREEVDTAIAAPAQPHPYLNYMLAELRDLRDHAFDLAAPDIYITTPNTPVIVSAEDGLLANDTLQTCRTTLVDTAFVSNMAYVAPQNGTVSVSADGSFTYTPNPGFTGSDRFTYRIGTSVAGLGCQPGLAMRGELDQFVYSNPANVVILVAAAAPPLCLGDANSDGTVNFTDITSVLLHWGTVYPGTTGPGDADQSGEVNFSDITNILLLWGTSCPS